MRRKIRFRDLSSGCKALVVTPSIYVLLFIGLVLFLPQEPAGNRYPNRCDFSATTKCEAMNFVTETHTLYLAMRNVEGKTITLNTINVTGTGNTPFAYCTILPATLPVTVQAGASVSLAATCHTSPGPPIVEIARADIVDLNCNINYVIPSLSGFTGTSGGYVHFRAS